MKKDVSLNQAIIELAKYLQTKYEQGNPDSHEKGVIGDIIEYFIQPMEGAVLKKKGHCVITTEE